MKNTYEIRGDVTVIKINSRKFGEQETLISTSKLERVQEFPNSWCVYLDKHTNSLYVFGNTPKVDGKKRNISLHRWLNYEPSDMCVDHIDHDTLNNTDKNLRILTNSENQQNRNGATKKSSTGILGVSHHKTSGKYQAQIEIKGEQKHLGLFEEIEHAERAVKEARVKFMPFSLESLKEKDSALTESETELDALSILHLAW